MFKKKKEKGNKGKRLIIDGHVVADFFLKRTIIKAKGRLYNFFLNEQLIRRDHTNQIRTNDCWMSMGTPRLTVDKKD